MEEKLNELLEKAELRIMQYDRTRVEINHKMKFLREAGFNKELEWLNHQKDSMIDIFEDYKNTVKDIKDMLNNEVESKKPF